MIRNTSQTVYWNVLKLFVFHCNLPAMTFKVWGGNFDLWNHKSGIRGVISDHAQWCFAELITLTCAVAHAAWVWGSLWVSSGARLGWFTTLGSLSLSFWPYMDRQRVSSHSPLCFLHLCFFHFSPPRRQYFSYLDSWNSHCSISDRCLWVPAHTWFPLTCSSFILKVREWFQEKRKSKDNEGKTGLKINLL